MRRAILSTLLVALFLFAGTLQAQRGGGAFRGGAAGFGGRPGFRGNSLSRSRLRNFNTGLFPFWYDDLYDDEQPYMSSAPMPPVILMQPDKSQSATQPPPAASPKVIELPGTATSAASKPLPLAMFILTNGERLEARRYMLTHNSLFLTVDREQRTIPLVMLDIRATVAADHERGIDLRIPADRSEITLSF
jgi:hypothetical protein